MRVKKTKSVFGLVVDVTIALLLAVGVGAASPYTVTDVDLLFALGLNSKKKEAAPKANLGDSSTATKGDIFTKDLQVGNKGADVIALQNLLGVTPAIGVFGELTKAAVIKYQISKGINPATGYVGAKTRESLEKEIADKTSLSSPSTGTKTDLFTKYLKAGDEGKEVATKANVSSPSTATKGDVFTKDLKVGSKEKDAPAKANAGSPSTAAKGDIFTRDLQVGSRGADVTALQNLLGVTPAIGVFGELTKAAVIKYQLSKGISPATGYVGAKTRASLNAAAGTEPRP